MRRQCGCREVATVEGDDGTRAGTDRRRQYVPVLRVDLFWLSSNPHRLPQVPVDSHALTHGSPAVAGRWRYGVRETVVPLMANGYRVVRFVRVRGDALPYYVFSRDPASLPLPLT